MVEQSRQNYLFMGADGDMPDLTELMNSPLLSVDVETNDKTDIVTARLVGTSVTDSTRHSYMFQDNRQLKNMLSPEKPTVMFSGTFDRSILKQHGILVNNVIDPKIGGHLLERKPLDLRTLSCVMNNYDFKTYNDLPKKLTQMSPQELAAYTCPHSIAALLLWKRIEPELVKWRLDKIFNEILCPMIPILSDMELAGALIDKAQLTQLGVDFDNKLTLLNETLDSLANVDINWGSADQVAWVLFDKLKLPKGGMTPSGKRPSVDIEELMKLVGKHPIINPLIMHRQLIKLKGNYVTGLLKELDSNDRAHTNFNITGTATGRLSSTKPNLQNIPARRPEGRKIRKAFIAPPGYVLIKADYDQLELKTIAHFSQDQRMLRIYNEKGDIHRETAIGMFGELLAARDEIRFIGKQSNFMIVYLAGDNTISSKVSELLIKAGETKLGAQRHGWAKKFFETYPGVSSWIKTQIERAHDAGYVRTLFGRIRTIPEFAPEMQGKVPAWLIDHCEKIAVNTPVQGTAAELVDIGMINLYNGLKKGGYNSRMILQVHDEVLLEVPQNEAKDVVQLMKDTLPYNELSIPITVSLSMGSNWRDLDKIKAN